MKSKQSVKWMSFKFNFTVSVVKSLLSCNCKSLISRLWSNEMLLNYRWKWKEGRYENKKRTLISFDAEMHDISESYVDSTLGTEVYALSVSLWIDFRSVVHHRRIHPVHEAKGSESVVRHQTIRVNCFENEKICFARSVSIHCYLYNGEDGIENCENEFDFIRTILQ